MSFSSMPFGTSSEPLLESQRDAQTHLEQKTDRLGLLARLQIPGFTLRRAWLLAHLLFSACMFSTFFIYTWQAGTVIIGLVGISWAMTLWAPFAFISAEVAHMDAERRLRHRQSEMEAPMTSVEDSHDNDDVENGGQSVRGAKLSLNDNNDDEEDNLAQAGIILGLHNVAISFPQVFSSLISSAIFKALQKPRGEPWDDSVGWVLRFGGCAALIAAYLTRRLSEGSR